MNIDYSLMTSRTYDYYVKNKQSIDENIRNKNITENEVVQLFNNNINKDIDNQLIEHVDFEKNNFDVFSKEYTHSYWLENKSEYLDYDKHIGDTAKSVLLNADLGLGKTSMWLRSNKKFLILVPLRTIKGQNSHPCIDTYDSAIKYQIKINNKEIVPEETVLILDELHNLYLVSNYRTKAVHDIMDLINNNSWKQVIYQSATITNNVFDGLISFDKSIYIRKKGSPIVNYYIRNDASIIKSVIRFISEQSPLKKKTLVLVNSEDSVNDINVCLNGLNIKSECVTSALVNTKDSFAYNFANTVDFKMNDIDVIVGTSSLVEGININDELLEATVIVVGQNPLEHIKQLYGRFRNCKIVNMYHFANWGNYRLDKAFQIEDTVEDDYTRDYNKFAELINQAIEQSYKLRIGDDFLELVTTAIPKQIINNNPDLYMKDGKLIVNRYFKILRKQQEVYKEFYTSDIINDIDRSKIEYILSSLGITLRTTNTTVLKNKELGDQIQELINKNKEERIRNNSMKLDLVYSILQESNTLEEFNIKYKQLNNAEFDDFTHQAVDFIKINFELGDSNKKIITKLNTLLKSNSSKKIQKYTEKLQYKLSIKKSFKDYALSIMPVGSVITSEAAIDLMSKVLNNPVYLQCPDIVMDLYDSQFKNGSFIFMDNKFIINSNSSIKTLNSVGWLNISSKRKRANTILSYEHTVTG